MPEPFHPRYYQCPIRFASPIPWSTALERWVKISTERPVRNKQLVFQVGKARIYSTCTCVKYAVNRQTIMETTKYKYRSNTPSQTHGESTTMSLERNKLWCALVWAFVKKSANCNSEDTYWSALARTKEASTPICLVSSCFTGSRAILVGCRNRDTKICK
jgi:hypothetical protein